MSKNILAKKRPEKRLLLSFRKRGGRGSSGRLTIRHRGGGAKKLYRMIDFGQTKINLPAKIIALEYDPYRTAFLMLLEYGDKERRYEVAPHGLKVGDEIMCSETAEIKPGNRLQLKNIPIGTMVYNIELEAGQGGKLVRGAGTAAKVMGQEGNFTHLEMPSGEIRKFSQRCFASVGQVSHPEKKFEIIGKAGRRRLMGWRPTVRGGAMNPPDHPHGGGEGKTPIGMKYAKTPWGKHAFGVKTRKRKKTNKYIIQRRKKK
jgi:large subunit ribosomal protein L2